MTNPSLYYRIVRFPLKENDKTVVAFEQSIRYNAGKQRTS